MQGQVWVYDLESADWIAAVRNRPQTTGDRVATDGDGRAELRIGSSTIRLAAGSEIDFLQIDDEHVRVQLHEGRMALRLRSHEAAREFELVSAEGRFQPERAGRYRMDRIDATTSVTVWSGQLLFQAPDNAATVIAGQRADIEQVDGRTRYTLLQPARDAFADEVAAAEAAAERSVSTTRYVSPEMTGAEVLDGHGRWVNDVDHGALGYRARWPGWAFIACHWAFIRPGAGPGSTMRRGALRRSTTGAGCSGAAGGAGLRGSGWRARSTRRRSWAGSARRACRSRSTSARAWAGFRSARARCSCRPTA
jgi:hypothetical protein